MMMPNEYGEGQQKGLLLYLSPESSLKLKVLLKSLDKCLKESPEMRTNLHHIRKALGGLLYALSPISRTGKILFEILEGTRSSIFCDYNFIQNSTRELEEIYEIHAPRDSRQTLKTDGPVLLRSGGKESRIG